MTEQALLKLRRKRLARRLIQSEPLFAFEILKAQHPDYTQEQFQKDITIKRARNRRKKKNPLVKYGRYATMKQLLQEYEQTGDIGKALLAQKLRDRITQPYRIESWFNGVKETFYCSAILDMKRVKVINRMADEAASLEGFIKQVEEYLRYDAGVNFYHAKKAK